MAFFYCFALTSVTIPSKLFEGQKTEGMKEDATYAKLFVPQKIYMNMISSRYNRHLIDI